jgi:hypothetical protein
VCEDGQDNRNKKSLRDEEILSLVQFVVWEGQVGEGIEEEQLLVEDVETMEEGDGRDQEEEGDVEDVDGSDGEVDGSDGEVDGLDGEV